MVLEDKSREMDDDDCRRSDDNLKELMIRIEKTMEKMKRRQEILDGKLDKMIAQLNGTEGGCSGSVKKEEPDDKFIVSCLDKCSPSHFNCAVQYIAIYLTLVLLCR